MAEHIKIFDTDSEYFFEEGCHIVEVSNSQSDEQASIARARVEPGGQTRWHRLVDTFERYVILEGTGLVEIGDQAGQQVSIGDVVLIPPMVRQRIKNLGDKDLKFLAICTPRFRHENYQDAESE